MSRDPRDFVVYFVTTLGPGRARTVGYFRSFDDARKCVEENWGDIYEAGYYPYAVIEAMPEGLYPAPLLMDRDHQTWYRWRNEQIISHLVSDFNHDILEEAGYKPCDRPSRYDNVISMSIG